MDPMRQVMLALLLAGFMGLLGQGSGQRSD
jgi:hypothetical protein